MPLNPHTLFQLLSDPTRLRCMVLLSREGELCVCELTSALDEIQPKVSRHLALMRKAGLVSARRQGQWVFYRMDPDLPAFARRIIEITAGEAAAQAPFTADQARLAAMTNRPAGRCCA